MSKVDGVASLKLTYPLKIDGWKTIRLPFGIPPIFRGENASFRECDSQNIKKTIRQVLCLEVPYSTNKTRMKVFLPTL